MNVVFDVAEQFPAYTFDDIFDLEYSIVFSIQERNKLIESIKENLVELNK